MRRRAQKQRVETASRNKKQQLISEARHRLNILRFPRWGPKKLAEIRRAIRDQNKTISETELDELVGRIRAVSEYGGKGISKEKAAVLKAFLEREGIYIEGLYGIYTADAVKYALESQNTPQVIATSRPEEVETLKKLRQFLRAWGKAKKKGLI